jgi:hypothetical protein
LDLFHQSYTFTGIRPFKADTDAVTGAVGYKTLLSLDTALVIPVAAAGFLTPEWPAKPKKRKAGDYQQKRHQAEQ